MDIISIIGILIGLAGLGYAYIESKRRASLENVFKEQVRSIIRVVDSIRDRSVSHAKEGAETVAIGGVPPVDLRQIAAMVVGNIHGIDDRLVDLRMQLDAVWTGQFGEERLPQPVIIRQPEVADPSTTDPRDTRPT